MYAPRSSVRIHRVLHLASITALFFFTASVRAQTGAARKVRLEYVRPGGEACPSEDVLRHVIRTRTKDDPFSSSAKALLRVTIVRKGRAFQSRWELRDDAGELVKERLLPAHTDNALSVSAGGRAGAVWSPPFLPSGLGIFGSLDLTGAIQRSNIAVRKQLYWTAPELTGALAVGARYSF